MKKEARPTEGEGILVTVQRMETLLGKRAAHILR
jgi:hypothetical protein